MPRIFVNRENIENGRILLAGQDAHHVSRVLRMKPGEKLTVCDFFNVAYDCVICSSAGDTVELEIVSSHPSSGEFSFPVTLYMALPKGDKMEWIVQKSVELGVTRIVPFSSRYTVVRLDAPTGEKKRDRWQKIARAAAEQCGRGIVPEVALPVRFGEALAGCAAQPGVRFICDEAEEQTSLRAALTRPEAKSGVSFFIGAEGGFDREEIAAAVGAGLTPVTLGRRILRCETAPLYVLSAVGFLSQE